MTCAPITLTLKTSLTESADLQFSTVANVYTQSALAKRQAKADYHNTCSSIWVDAYFSDSGGNICNHRVCLNTQQNSRMHRDSYIELSSKSTVSTLQGN